jgi:selenocysteine-specific elongation factor
MTVAAGYAFQAVVGTAGHIDHGKSSLVKNLTGTDPDRLKEEQARGLTIDLGYAEYRAADGRDIGLIDVPGHEKFVRNMVAGAAGVDVVMLVVAADDGVMPQTREHLDILQLLGVERGFCVLTKTDLVDADMADLAEMDLRDATRGTFLETAPVIRCSNATRAGLDLVRAELERQVALVPPRDEEAVFRLPIQRSFTVKGHGTVVTGVPASGSIAPGDELEIQPRGLRCRVRGVQVHHRPADRAGQGQRVALNLSDVNWKDVDRGDVACTPGLFQATKLVEVRFRYLPAWDRPLQSHTEVKFHAGCVEATGRLVLLNRKEIAPGESCLAQVRLEEPTVVAPGDRYLVRCPSPERTFGGGVILGETRFRQKQSKTWVSDNLAAKEASLGDRDAYFEAVVRGEGLHPVGVERLKPLVHESAEAVAEILKRLAAAGVVVEIPGTREYLHRDGVRTGALEAERALLTLHEANHYAFGFDARAVASAIRHPPAVAAVFLGDCVQRKSVERQGDEYRLKAFKGGLSQEDRRLIGTVEERLRATGFATPSPTEIAKELDRPEKRILNLVTALEAQKKAKTIADGVVLHADALRDARERLVKHCLAHGELTSNFAKDLFGATRKYVIPLLEHFDAIGLTLRKDSSRTLKPGYETRDAL